MSDDGKVSAVTLAPYGSNPQIPLGNNILEHHFDALQNPRPLLYAVTLARWCLHKASIPNAVALALCNFFVALPMLRSVDFVPTTMMVQVRRRER